MNRQLFVPSFENILKYIRSCAIVKFTQIFWIQALALSYLYLVSLIKIVYNRTYFLSCIQIAASSSPFLFNNLIFRIIDIIIWNSLWFNELNYPF